MKNNIYLYPDPTGITHLSSLQLQVKGYIPSTLWGMTPGVWRLDKKAQQSGILQKTDLGQKWSTSPQSIFLSWFQKSINVSWENHQVLGPEQLPLTRLILIGRQRASQQKSILLFLLQGGVSWACWACKGSTVHQELFMNQWTCMHARESCGLDIKIVFPNCIRSN